MRRTAYGIGLVFVVIAAGCEREPAAPAPVQPAPVRPTLEIRPIAPLSPARRTHIAVDGRGNVFWSQEEDDGSDVVFAVGEDGVPRATGLTAAAAIAATGEAAGDEATANIQSLAFGPDEALYFFITGGTQRRTIAALGRYIPATSKIELIAPTNELKSAAGMGRSIALARGTVIASGQRLVFWLRHTDSSLMLEIDPRADGSLSRAPDVRGASGPLLLRRENQFLAAGRGGSLLLLDLGSNQLLSIDPSGRANELLNLSGLPRALSLPAEDPGGAVRIFAGNAPLIPPSTENQAGRAEIEYPALLTILDRRLTALSRRDFDAHSGFLVGGMKLQLLVPDRAGGYVAYDDSSGELLRLRVHGRTGDHG